MDTVFPGYTRHDRLIACAVTIMLWILAGMQLTNGVPSWGDDFAAYITEGISISTGTLEEQAIKNYILHPSELPDEASTEGLVYAWGYPLLLSLVHRAVGFDTGNFTSVIFYKIPSLLAYGLAAGVLYLFCRRRFSRLPAFVLTLLFSLNHDVFFQVEALYGDVLFLFVFLLSLLLADCYYDTCLNPTHRTWILGTALGIAMWYACETRLNGVTVAIVTALGHLLRLIPGRQRLSLRSLPPQLLPYGVLTVFWFGSCLFLPPATSNLSDIGKADLQTVFENIQLYCELMCNYFDTLIPGIPLWPLAVVLTAIGLYREGLKNLPFTALLLGTWLVLILLPYTQGLRYLLNVLPLLLMYTAWGAIFAFQWLCGKLHAFPRKVFTRALAVLILVPVLAAPLTNGIANLKNQRQPEWGDVYEDTSVELYHYIQQNIPQDALICFRKPRALYLNTGRMGFCPDVNGHILEDADYYLFCAAFTGTGDWEFVTEHAESLRQVWSNQRFLLYEVLK